MKKYCESRGFHFIVQLITIKKHGIPSDVVDRVALKLADFLNCLDRHGNTVSSTRPTFHYHYMVHSSHSDSCHFEKNAGINLSHNSNKNSLPAVHLCSRNHSDKCLSKALVMQTIAEHFYNPIPAENIFLLDNNLHNVKEALTGSNGLTPCYQAMSAHALETLKKASKEERTFACQFILEQFKYKIITRISVILASLQPEIKKCWLDMFLFKPLRPTTETYSPGPHLKLE